MSYMLACEVSNVFTAVAPVAGCMMSWLYDSCQGDPPVPVFEIHDTNDNVTWWNGDLEDIGGWGPYVSIETGIDLWVEKNNCTELTNELVPNTALDGSNIISHKHMGCTDNNEVWLYDIIDGGHDWPGSGGNMDIKAGIEVWNFFTRFIDSISADVNQDGQINVADIVILVPMILGTVDASSSADLNSDEQVNVQDIIVLINIILGIESHLFNSTLH